MGSGADYTRRVAREEALKSLQNYFVREANKSCCCQLAKLDGSKTKGTLASGQVVDIQPIGLPGQYCMTCPLHNSKRAAIKPEPIQIHVDGNNSKAYIAGKLPSIPLVGQPIRDTRSRSTLSQITSSPFYIRKIGRSASSDAKKYLIPINLLDSRIDPATVQIRFSADGNALLIGGFFQDHPPEELWGSQVSEGTGGCQGNCTAIPGYDYHTYASWAVYAGISVNDAQDSGSFIDYEFSTSGIKDITLECFNKITAPQEQNLGSSSVYRLFPTLSDVLGANGTGQVLGDSGYRLDLNGNPVDARFYPNTHDYYTWYGNPYDYIQPSSPFAHYYLESLHGSGDLRTIWSNDSNNNPLFINHRNSSIAITDSNLIYSFNGDGTTYTVDIVGDISYATIYYVVSSDIRMEGNAQIRVVGGASNTTFQSNCDYSQRTYKEFDYTYQKEYPYLAISYNSFFDINNMTNVNILQRYTQPVGPNIHQYSSSGTTTSTFTSGLELITNTSAGTSTSSLTSCGVGTIFSGEFVDWTYEEIGGRVCSGCDLSNAADYLFYASGDTHTVVNWDGSSITIIDDPVTPYAGLECFIPHISTVTGQCNDQALSLGCCDQFFYGHIADNTYTQYLQLNTLGFVNSYRYGRGICSLEGVSTIVKSNTGSYSASNSYIGPRIQISRLSSHSNQNHLLGAFRSRSGERACVYEAADPFTIEASAGLIDLTEYLDDFAAGLRGEENAFFDALFNGENVLQDLPTNRFNTSNKETRPSDSGFCRYYWANPYVNTGNNLAIPTNDVLPPDVFTDKILAGFGTFPVFIEGGQVYAIATTPPTSWNLYYPKLEPEKPPATTLNLSFPCNQLKGVDSYVVNGYRRKTINRPNPVTGLPQTVEVATISEYNIAEDGETSFGRVIIDNSATSNSQEVVMDYLISI